MTKPVFAAGVPAALAAIFVTALPMISGGCASATSVTAVASAPVTAAPMATAADYTRVCGICHLQNGEGVPGAFPPLNKRLAALGDSDAGRSYLVGILKNGLYGQITVEGTSYNGAMPPISGQLDSQGMAGMLNYVLSTFAASEAGFTAEEIATRSQAIGSITGASLRLPLSDALQ